MAAIDLTTAQRAADFIGLGTLAGADLTKMNLLVTQVSKFVQNEIGYNLKRAERTEDYDTNAGDTLVLKTFPVDSTFTVVLKRRTSIDNEAEFETSESTDFFVDYNTGVIKFAGGRKFHKGPSTYRVTYRAGYDFDNSSTFLSDTEAADVELAVWLLLAAVWNRGASGGGIERESIGDYSVQFKSSMLESEEVQKILDNYRHDDLGAFIL